MGELRHVYHDDSNEILIQSRTQATLTMPDALGPLVFTFALVKQLGEVFIWFLHRKSPHGKF